MKNPKVDPSPNPVQSPEQIQDQIRQRAYELYESRGRDDGHDLEDWLLAESEVNRKPGVNAV